MSSILTFDFAKELFDSESQFPVDFELAWQWLGYSRKDSAKRHLTKNFEEGVDYITVHTSVDGEESRVSGTFVKTENIFLSVNCLKEFGMIARTQKGKEVRQYFLKCEQLAKQFLKENKVIVRGTQLTNELNQKYEELKNLSPVMADNFVRHICPQPVSSSSTSESVNDVNNSLVINRIGLAFNKHLKAFDTLQDSLSPESYIKLRTMYQDLLAEHTELLKTKTPVSKIEFVEKIVEKPVIVEKIVEVPDQSQSDEIALIRRKLHSIELDLLTGELVRRSDTENNSSKSSRFQLPPSN